MDKEEKNEADVLEENKKKKQQEEADKAKKDEPPPVVMDTRLLKAGDYELHVNNYFILLKLIKIFNS